ETEQGGDATSVRSASIGLDRDLGGERADSIDDDRGGSRVESRGIRDAELQRDLVGTRRMSVDRWSVAVGGGQSPVDLRRVERGSQPAAELLIAEDGRESREHAKMLFGRRRQPDDEVRTLVAPQNSRGELGHRQAGPKDEASRFVRA